MSITLFYHSPNSPNENNTKLLDILTTRESNAILIGDLNMPDVDWSRGTGPTKHREFLQLTEENSLSQVIDFSTHAEGNILDVVLVNKPENILDLRSLGYLGGSDHKVITRYFI